MSYEHQTCTNMNLLGCRNYLNTVGTAFVWFQFWLEIARKGSGAFWDAQVQDAGVNHMAWIWWDRQKFRTETLSSPRKRSIVYQTLSLLEGGVWERDYCDRASILENAEGSLSLWCVALVSWPYQPVRRLHPIDSENNRHSTLEKFWVSVLERGVILDYTWRHCE